MQGTQNVLSVRITKVINFQQAANSIINFTHHRLLTYRRWKRIESRQPSRPSMFDVRLSFFFFLFLSTQRSAFDSFARLTSSHQNTPAFLLRFIRTRIGSCVGAPCRIVGNTASFYERRCASRVPDSFVSTRKIGMFA